MLQREGQNRFLKTMLFVSNATTQESIWNCISILVIGTVTYKFKDCCKRTKGLVIPVTGNRLGTLPELNSI